ncbi:MAG TPA: hypothetical protein VN455_03650 [Methanotrichaceae archaeon]|nr:hypothetical protein [Methanotrichaceae archaeon]
MSLIPITLGLLIATVAATSSIGAGSDEALSDGGDSPLYDYRYIQAAEELGLLGNGASEKLSFGSIPTDSLNPRDACDESKVRLTIKDAGETSYPSCGLASCVLAKTCGDTCMGTCASTCRYSCGYTCGGTCSNTCYGTCRSTCGHTCEYTCSNTCRSTCSNTCSNTCSGTCAQTCSDTCGTKCAQVPDAPLAGYVTESPQASEQNSLMPYDAEANPPVYVYYDDAKVPWATYKMRSIEDPLNWVEIDDDGWGVAARAPLGAWVMQPIYVPVSGDLVLYTITTDGVTNRDYGETTPGYRYLWFYADKPGTHTRVFFIEGIKSNEVTISVS